MGVTGMSGFEVDPSTLRKASSDVVGAVQPVGSIDLEGISGSSGWYGHEGVYEAFARFCPTWQVAVTLLAQRSMEAGLALDGMAQNYVQADDTGAQRMTWVNVDEFPQH